MTRMVKDLNWGGLLTSYVEIAASISRCWYTSWLCNILIFTSLHTHFLCFMIKKKLINLTCFLYPKQFLLNSVWFWFHFGPYPLTGLHHCPHVSPFCDHLHLHICAQLWKREQKNKSSPFWSAGCVVSLCWLGQEKTASMCYVPAQNEGTHYSASLFPQTP